MGVTYAVERRRRLMRVFESRAPRYRHRDPARLSKKAKAVLRRPVPIESVLSVTEALTGIAHAVIGGHAVAIHGVPRMTEDVDILIASRDVDRAVRALGGMPRKPLAIGGWSLRVRGTPVDLVAPDEPWVDGAIEQAVRTPYGRVIGRPHLIVMKLWAMRGEQDDTDAISLLRVMDQGERRAARELVERYLPAEAEDFDSMARIADM